MNFKKNILKNLKNEYEKGNIYNGWIYASAGINDLLIESTNDSDSVIEVEGNIVNVGYNVNAYTVFKTKELVRIKSLVSSTFEGNATKIGTYKTFEEAKEHLQPSTIEVISKDECLLSETYIQDNKQSFENLLNENEFDYKYYYYDSEFHNDKTNFYYKVFEANKTAKILPDLKINDVIELSDEDCMEEECNAFMYYISNGFTVDYIYNRTNNKIIITDIIISKDNKSLNLKEFL